MSDISSHIRTRKEIKQRLLKKAIQEGRGAEMILLIQWRLEQVRHDFSEHKEVLEESLNVNEGQPRSVRMLNTLASHKGLSKRFIETASQVLSKGTDTLH